MNVGADFVTAIGLLALQSSPNPLSSTFDLNDLDQHNFPIEHDASLSRQDAYFGIGYAFDQSIFNQVLAYFEGMGDEIYSPDFVSISSARGLLRHKAPAVYIRSNRHSSA